MKNFIIYVHGRPQGQDFWCKEELTQDRHYLNMFLDSRVGSEVSSAMIIDIWNKNTYYTYLHCKNVIENSGRSGAYFAITIRFDNAYCKSVSTLYNLLDQIYKHFCVGNLISTENGCEKICFSQFSEKSDILKRIDDVISQNLEQVISPLCIALDDCRDTKDTSAKAYCLSDVDSPTFISDMQKSKLVVSPSYKSKEKTHEEDVLRLKPLEQERDGLKRELSDWQSRHASLEENRRQQEVRINSLSKEVDQLTANADKVKEQVESQYKSSLAQKDKDLKETQNKLESVKNQLETQTSQLRECKNQLTTLQREVEKSKKDTLSQNDKEDLLRRMAERFPELETNSANSKSSANIKISNCFSIINCVLLICVSAVVTLLFLRVECIPKKNDEGNHEIIKQIEEPSKKMNPEIVSDNVLPSDNGESSTLSSIKYKIDLPTYRGDSRRLIGTPYNCDLKPMNGNTNPSMSGNLVWSVIDGNAVFQNNSLTFNDSLSVTIICKDSSGNELSRRTFKSIKE